MRQVPSWGTLRIWTRSHHKEEDPMTANNPPDPAAPDTIVLIHGLWMTPRSWEHWVERYSERGYRVLASAYPGLDVEVEALREDPSDCGVDRSRGRRSSRRHY